MDVRARVAGGLARARRPRAWLTAAAAVVALGVPSAALASAPYMGVNTWYGFGASINEHTIVQLTDSIVARGLRAAGYRYVWLDAGWWFGARDPSGQIIVNPTQWPHGMAWLTHYIHSKGLRAGIYTDIGEAACRNGGSLGHFQQDVDTFASWGFDAVKGDFCGAYKLHLDPRTEYTAFARAIADDRPHRPMILYVGNGDTWSKDFRYTAMDDWSWAPHVAASWRTWDDLSWPHGITWGTLLRNIDADSAHPQAAGHGHWNDPDYLAPTKLPPQEARAQFTMWIILAAPLMVSADITTLSPSTISMLTNRQALAISQDRLGRQGTSVVRRKELQVWTKPLANGSKGVAVLNRGETPKAIELTGSMIGLGSGPLRVLNVWSDRTWRRRSIHLKLPGHSAVLLHAWSAGRTQAP